MDDGKRSDIPAVIQFTGGQLIALGFVGDGISRKDGNPGIDFQGSFNGFHVIEFHNGGNFDSCITQNFVGSLPSGNIFLECDKILSAQILDGDIFLLGN